MVLKKIALTIATASVVSLAAPVLAKSDHTNSTKFPACSATVTDNCIQHERGSSWAKHHYTSKHHWKRWHHSKGKHHAMAKPKAKSKDKSKR